jgi:pimeloyl-ACP methyl ester carboxylesterase
MRHVLIAAIHRLFAVTFLAATLNVQPVSAQLSGDTAEYVTANYATRLARYYAPYALQAAAAYTDVASFDATRGPSQQPPLDGSDVRLAVAGYPEDVAKAATKYLQAWQYQFGSAGYLTCFESDPDCLKAIRKDRWTLPISGGPTFHVWARTRAFQKEGAACSEVSIAFRGSTLSTADWITNADPVTGYVFDDHYRQLRRNIDAIIKKITRLDCYRRATSRPQIVSVGHSLGAGLAQFSALANNPAGPRIRKVFAFDSSPVTGASYIDKGVRIQNADVEIDQVYQSGEALQRLRPAKPSSPCVRTVVFDAILPAGAATLHNMPALARETVRMTYDDENGEQMRFRLPKKLPKCPSQYLRPQTDEDKELAPDGVLVSSRDGSATRVAGANRGRAVDSYAMSGGFAFASPPPTQMNGAVATSNARRSDASMGKRVGRVQAPAVHVSLDAAWPPG